MESTGTWGEQCAQAVPACIRRAALHASCWGTPACTAAWCQPAALHVPQHRSRCSSRRVHTDAPLGGGQAVNLLRARLDHSAIHHLVGRHSLCLHLAVQLEGLLRISRSRAGCNPKDSAGRRVRRWSALPPCFRTSCCCRCHSCMTQLRPPAPKPGCPLKPASQPATSSPASHLTASQRT